MTVFTQWRRLYHLGPLLLAFVQLQACRGETNTEEVRQIALQQVSVKYSVLLPGTAVLGTHALVAGNRLQVHDRVTVIDADNEPAAVASAGSQETLIGVDAKVGDVLSHGRINLRNRALVDGDATTSSTIHHEPDSSVTGTKTTSAPNLSPPLQESFEIEFGGVNSGDVNVEPPKGSVEGVKQLAPGRYGRVSIKSRNRLELVSGTYTFDELNLEPQTRIVVDDASGPVLINIENSFLYKSKIESRSGSHPAVRVAYVGQNAVVLETRFDGALLAPNASVRLATNTPQNRHVGVFFAKDLSVSPDVTVEFRPYWSYTVEKEWTSSGAPGRLGAAGVTTEGEVLADSLTNVVRITEDGLISNELDTDARRLIAIGEGSTGYAYLEGDVFKRFRADGSGMSRSMLIIEAAVDGFDCQAAASASSIELVCSA